MKVSGIPLAASLLAAWAGTHAVFDGQDSKGIDELGPASVQHTSIRFIDGFFHALGHVIGIGHAEAAVVAPICPDDYGGPLSISDLVPSSGSVSETDLAVIFCGSGFTYGTQVYLSRQDPQNNTLTLIPNWMSRTWSNQMDAEFDLSRAATGFWDAWVYDAVVDKTVTLPRGFFVWGDSLDVIGVSRITPSVGWNTGYTRLQIRGLGFDPDAVAQLTRSGMASVTGKILERSNSMIVADFDLHHMEVGTWDVVVSNPDDGASATLAGGFSVEAGARPMVRVSMVGPEIARLDRFTNYDIQLYNTGLVDARGLIVIHGIPADAEWRLNSQPNPLFELPGSYQLLDMPDGKTVIVILPTTVIRSKQEINFGIEIRVPILPGATERNYRINVIWDQFLS